ncbi:hypothetical protein [Flavobacterium sp. 2]|uniref:hypothetical protein n=1 Tax=Flavobacterium sp. 2 TaxID=308053 RepID=UPI003CED7F1D
MKILEGKFEVIDSFVIRNRNEFYLIGQIKEGIIKENWFVNIPFNKSLSMTIRISAIEDVEFSSEDANYKLIIVKGDSETLDFLLGLKIESELLEITVEGQD